MAKLFYYECMKASKDLGLCSQSQDWGCLLCYRKTYQLAQAVNRLNISLRDIKKCQRDWRLGVRERDTKLFLILKATNSRAEVWV